MSVVAAAATSAPTLSDLANVATFLLLGAGQVVTWRMLGRDDRRGSATRAAERAKLDADNAAALKSLADSHADIAALLRKVEDWTREHEISDEKRWAASEQLQIQQHELNERVVNIQEDLSRRITNVALHQAPGPAVELPATARTRRR